MTILERNDTGAVAHLRMNAPERLNALSDEMIATLHKALDDIAADNTIRAVILSGAGNCLLYTSPSPRDLSTSRMPSSA